MALTTYTICPVCGGTIEKRVIKMTGDDTNDGIKYVKGESKYCGCKNAQIRADIAKGV